MTRSMSFRPTSKVVQRCLLMATDPGDLVLDPTCGSGTTAYVAEQWGRRWITIDTSRVALALARARIMGARYPYYLLADSREGQTQGSRSHRALRQVRSPCTGTSATASSTSACRTSRSSPSPTTPRSMSSGTSGRRSWSRCARSLNAALKQKLAGVGDPARGRRQVAGRGEEAARRLVAGPHRPAEGDRRLHRRQGRIRVPLRQALRGQEEGPRGRALHRREPLAPSRAWRGRERRVDRSAPEDRVAKRRKQSFRPDDPGEPQDRRRAAGAQGRPRSPSPSLTPWPGDLVCAEGRYLEGDDRTRSGPPSSSVRSSAPSSAPTWSPPPARRATPGSTC